MTDALRDVLQRLVDSSLRNKRGYPRAPWSPDISPFIWVGEKDAEGWCAWQPVRKGREAPLAEALGGLPPVHEVIHHYFDNWWFLSLDGKLEDLLLSFNPNPPGLNPDYWAALLRTYAAAHDGRLDHIPIGLDEDSSLQIVVDNRTGELSIEDWETGEHEVIAESLDDAFRRMVV
jgi:hypothetical protein